MTRFLPLVFGFLIALGISPEVSAQLIDPTVDLPSNLANANNAEGSLKRVIVTIINWALGFLGLIAVIFVIYGGYLYILARGDESGAEKGRQVIIYTVIGIIIILLSFAIVNTVLGAATGQAPI